MADNSESSTLWVGNIEPWMDENYVSNLFSKSATAVSVKLIKDRETRANIGYGFIEFETHEIAAQIFAEYNGAMNPTTSKPFRLNWGAHRSSDRPQPDRNSSRPSYSSRDNSDTISLYVGDLSASTTKEDLLDHFKDQFSSVIGSNLIMDPMTRTPKGYGFVQFSSLQDAEDAISDLNGTVLNGKRIKVNMGQHKKRDSGGRGGDRGERGGHDYGRGHGGDRDRGRP